MTGGFLGKKVILKTFNDLGETPKGAWFIPYFFYNLVVSKLIKSRLPSGEGLDEKVRLYRHYMTYKRVFDNESTMTFIKDKGIPLPHFEDYLKTLMSYAIKDKWERKRNILAKRSKRVVS